MVVVVGGNYYGIIDLMTEFDEKARKKYMKNSVGREAEISLVPPCFYGRRFLERILSWTRVVSV